MSNNADTSVLAFHDIRWNSWRWKPILEKWGHLRVFINPEMVKTASFLMENNEPVSTVFFLRMDHGLSIYAVTTRHSICESDVSIRFNRRGGGVKDEPTLQGDWLSDRDSDVAILPLDFMWDKFKDYEMGYVDHKDLRSYTDHYYFGNQFPENHPPPIRYGPGDEVFSVGLFDRHFGNMRATQPVARFGHVVLVPGLREKIWANVRCGEDYKEIDAFLVEIASWGGQSGSPVFLRPSKVYSERSRNRPPWEKNLCIGMLQGFYPGEQEVVIDGRDATLSPLNMGIGIVIPVRKITELLMRPDVKDMREKAKEARLKKIQLKHKPSAASE